jgi:hypothetical protein
MIRRVQAQADKVVAEGRVERAEKKKAKARSKARSYESTSKTRGPVASAKAKASKDDPEGGR